jgi:hypothetical protein
MPIVFEPKGRVDVEFVERWFVVEASCDRTLPRIAIQSVGPPRLAVCSPVERLVTGGDWIQTAPVDFALWTWRTRAVRRAGMPIELLLLDSIQVSACPQIERLPRDGRGCQKSFVEAILRDVRKNTSGLQYRRPSIFTEKP